MFSKGVTLGGSRAAGNRRIFRWLIAYDWLGCCVRTVRFFLLSLMCFSLPLACPAEEELRVLFIGNSYSFQVPKVFGKLAESEGKKVTVDQVTKGGWTLKKHAEAEATRKKIAGAEWDFVVLQEQSQIPSFPDAQKRMGEPVKTLAELAKKSGAKLVFFETWGRRDGDTRNRKDDTFAAMQNVSQKDTRRRQSQSRGRSCPRGRSGRK